MTLPDFSACSYAIRWSAVPDPESCSVLTSVVWCTPQAQGTEVECGYRGAHLLIARQHWRPISAALAAKRRSSEPPASELPFRPRVSFSAGSKKGHIIVQLPTKDMPDTRTQAGLALRLLRIVRPGCDVHGALPKQRCQGQTASAAEGIAAAEQQAYQQAVQEEDMHAGVIVSSPGPASSDDGGCGGGGGSAASQPPPMHPVDSAINSWVVVPEDSPAAERMEVSSKRSQPSSHTTQQQPVVVQSAKPPQGGPSGGGTSGPAAAKRKHSAADGAAGAAPAIWRQSQCPVAGNAAAAAPATPSQHSHPVADAAAITAPPQHSQPACYPRQAESAAGPSQPAHRQAAQPAVLPAHDPAGIPSVHFSCHWSLCVQTCSLLHWTLACTSEHSSALWWCSLGGTLLH
jgi:hypothetical protein